MPKLSADELRQVEASLRQLQVQRSGEGPWMELAGCLADEREELQSIGRVIREEFEGVNHADWQ
ncbi:MAG: hypothetical protein EOP83_22040 [Verrucomicrobiaceae bacterium]|nr:MAG: hypothetical protein EOP83_22040 [Verrucomicrobiaceae bacterium]